MNPELPALPGGFRKGRGTRDQIADIRWIFGKSRSSRKNFCFIDSAKKPLTVWVTTNSGKFLEMGISDHLACLLRNPYAGQEATGRPGHGTTDWFQIGKGREINNLRYADDTTLVAESEEQLKSLLMKVKEERKSSLKTKHSF